MKCCTWMAAQLMRCTCVGVERSVTTSTPAPVATAASNSGTERSSRTSPMLAFMRRLPGSEAPSEGFTSGGPPRPRLEDGGTPGDAEIVSRGPPAWKPPLSNGHRGPDRARRLTRSSGLRRTAAPRDTGVRASRSRIPRVSRAPVASLRLLPVLLVATVFAGVVGPGSAPSLARAEDAPDAPEPDAPAGPALPDAEAKKARAELDEIIAVQEKREYVKARKRFREWLEKWPTASAEMREEAADRSEDNCLLGIEQIHAGGPS